MTFTDEPVRPPRALNLSRRLRPRAGRLRVPPALLVLMATVTIIGITWALLVPPFQAPDETSHFAYAQSLATRFALPGQTGRGSTSGDQAVADLLARASPLSFYVHSVRPEWSARAFQAYLVEARNHLSDSDGGGPNAEAANPPLFYLYSDLAYWADGSYNLFGRLYAMRVWGVLLLLANVLGAWLLAGEVFAGRRVAQLVCAAVCGLMPMETFLATSVTPDALMVPLWTFGLWLGARLIRRGWRTRDAVGLCAVTAAAILTKATSYALLPSVLLAIVVAWRGVPSAKRRMLLRRAGAALATLAVPVLAWVAFTKSQGRSPINSVQAAPGAPARRGSQIGGFISYVWQFYLPKLPFLTGSEPQHHGLYNVWVKQGWGTFGWLDVRLPGWTYPLFALITAAVAVVDAVILLVIRRGRRLGLLLLFFAIALLALLVGLHVTAYRAFLDGQGPLLQGRYLLPVIGLFGLAVALIVVRVPRRWSAVVAGGVLAALLLLQVLSLATIAKTYYT